MALHRGKVFEDVVHRVLAKEDVARYGAESVAHEREEHARENHLLAT